MSVPVRKMEQSPESYAPKSRPVIISMAEELHGKDLGYNCDRGRGIYNY